MTDEELYVKLNDLIRTEGWKSFLELLTKRKNTLIMMMLNEQKIQEVWNLKMRLNEIDYLKCLPEQFIQEHKERKK